MVVTRNQARFNQDPLHLSIIVEGKVCDAEKDGNHEIIGDPKHVLTKSVNAMEDGKTGCRLSLPKENSILITFLNETSIHGVKYIAQENRHWSERLFWLVAFLLGVSSSAYLIHNLWDRYQKNPVIIIFDVNKVDTSSIPFPAVTICNVNLISKRLVEELESTLKETNSLETKHIEAEAKLAFVRLLCARDDPATSGESAKHYSHGKRLEDLIAFLINNTDPCEEMIRQCLFGSEFVNCSDSFKPIITSMGKCCTFNMLPLGILFKRPNDTLKRDGELYGDDTDLIDQFVEEQYFTKPANINHWSEWEPEQQMGPGRGFGLTVLIDSKLDDYYCPYEDSEGVRISLHSPFQIPDMDADSYGVHLGKQNDFAVDVDITKADPDIRDYPKEKRKCLFGNEKQLKYFHPYTEENCLEECWADYLATKCECKPYYIQNFHEEHMGKNICSRGPSSDNRNCTDQTEWELDDSICPGCESLCEEIEYSHSMSMNNLLSSNKLVQEYSEYYVRTDELNDTVAIANIYFKSARITPKLRKALYGWADLIANTGGILGLCLGFSVISGIELIYFFTLRAFWRTRAQRNAVVNRRLLVSCLERPFRSRSNVVNLHPCGLPEDGATKVQ